MFGVKIAIILLFIALIGIAILSSLNKYFRKSPYQFIIQTSAIAIILNIMVAVFIVLSFSKITFEPGEQGPHGIRGEKGDIGNAGGLSNCSKVKSMNAEEIKFATRRKELQFPKKPVIIED